MISAPASKLRAIALASAVIGAALVSPDQAYAAPGTFTPKPVFAPSGLALVVYSGGTIDDLEATTKDAGAIGAWLQDSRGEFQVLPVGAPAFLKRRLHEAFPPQSADGPNFPQVVPVTVVAPD